MEFTAEPYVPCVLECPPDSWPEGEPPLHDGYVDSHNGGCNSPELGILSRSYGDGWATVTR